MEVAQAARNSVASLTETALNRHPHPSWVERTLRLLGPVCCFRSEPLSLGASLEDTAPAPRFSFKPSVHCSPG